MPNTVTVTTDFNVPAEQAFAYLSDYTHTAEWLYGLTALKPLTEQTSGLGAKFDGTIKLGASLSSKLEVVEYDENRLFTLDSYEGIKNKSRWEISSTGPETCTLRATWEYDLGGGLAGKALGKVVEPVVKIAAKASTENLRKAVEGAAA